SITVCHCSRSFRRIRGLGCGTAPASVLVEALSCGGVSAPMMTRSLWLVFAVLLGTRTADGAEKRRIAVHDLKSNEDLRPLAKKTTEDILLRLGRTPNLTAIGEAEIGVLLEHQKDQVDAANCKTSEDEACLAKLNDLALTAEVITGRLGRFGNGFLVTLSLSDT